MKNTEKKRSKLTSNRSNVGYVFILPWMIGFVLFVGYPLIESFLYMLSDLDIANNTKEFVGLEHIMYAFKTDPYFIRYISESFGTLIYQVPMILVFSTFFGVVLNQKFRGRTMARAMMFLPVIIASGLVMSIIKGDYVAQTLLDGSKASTMFDVNVIQDFLIKLGIDMSTVNTLSEWASNIFELSWKSGIQILLIMAALQGVPKTLYEASSIEGATAWETFWKITFPMITPILFVNIIYTVIDSFTDLSSPIMSHIAAEQNALRLEYATTLSWLYSVLVFIVVGIVFVVVGRKVRYTEY